MQWSASRSIQGHLHLHILSVISENSRMTKISYTDIFVPGGFPRHTYNPRTGLALESKLVEVKQNLCKLAIVTGHTKSGKTVLVRKLMPRNDLRSSMK